jgi:hypothetical protein
MDPISVPAPPRSSYNPNRRVSDLLLSQLKHFQHIEQKRGDLGIDPAISRDIYTEAGAARYITAMTRALQGKSPAQPAKLTLVPPVRRPKKQPGSILTLAASADKPRSATAKSPAKNPGTSTSRRKKE